MGYIGQAATLFGLGLSPIFWFGPTRVAKWKGVRLGFDR